MQVQTMEQIYARFSKMTDLFFHHANALSLHSPENAQIPLCYLQAFQSDFLVCERGSELF